MKNLFFLFFFIFLTAEAMEKSKEVWRNPHQVPGSLCIGAAYFNRLDSGEVFWVSVSKGIGCNMFKINATHKQINGFERRRDYDQSDLSDEEQYQEDKTQSLLWGNMNQEGVVLCGIVRQLKLSIAEYERKNDMYMQSILRVNQGIEKRRKSLVGS